MATTFYVDYSQLERSLSYKEQTLEQFSDSLEPAKQVELYYPPLTIVVNQLLDYVMRDFVSSWWTPINVHHDPTFERLARERLNVVFLNVQKILLNQERNDIVMSTLYGVANTLIIHMRECRALEESELSMDDYVIENPQSPFAQLLSKEEQHRQLRGLSQTFLKRTLPTADRDSLLLMSLFKELLATFLFGGILDSLSDPDFLNCWIIDLLSDKDKSKSIASTVSAAAVVLTADDNSAPNVEPSSLAAESTLEHKQPDFIRKSTEEDNNLDQTTPPDTPEPARATATQLKPTPIVTTPKQEQTVLASLQSPPPPPSPLAPPSMIFSRGSVNFTIMDISAPQPTDQPLNKTELVYIVQIERPAMEDHAGSEGGGYVITRSYADFECFNAILHARHAKRTTKLQLKLPLDTTTKSWLKKSSTQQKKKVSLEAVGAALEKYIDTVVQDEELGTDQIILPFLRKERRAEITDGTVTSFAEEYKDEVAAAAAAAAATAAATSNTTTSDTASTSSGRSRSLFSRNSASNLNVASLSANSSKTDTAEERQSLDHDINNKWFAPKTKTRQGSVSSMQSNLSKDSSTTMTREDGDDSEEEKKHTVLDSAMDDDKPKRQNTPLSINNNKALSSMDVELLIETTYALVVEIFNLTSSNNKAWMRRSILNLLREIVRRSYAQFISEQYSDFIEEYMSPDAIVGMLNQLGEQFWPEGKWMLDGKEQVERTEQDKEKSKQLARTMLMNEMIPNAVRQLIGDQNCNTAMDRIWARCQDPNLNRVLILQVLERIIKPILG
ncbi:hypothetical protein HMPREF1544_02565 [Mucor circinelloides 1006PhL]|uniref:PXA domain-containing protein n=1 Tax=Mucor circinelloides f. circinelloides (strain 1006PhL) TaxID=1220926 RepID=S2KE59_MUCC1|nr:hypothetical protein HMPREF1544_02565 [Mucor circinelloides 1006PhL]